MNLPLTEKAVGSLLAAATGDALGWPFEDRSRRIQTTKYPKNQINLEEFFDWTRSGARSEPYREPIRAGEYSDDTQLLLATARSVMCGNDWWENFAFVELPSWLLYERGGGGATKRAAQSLLGGVVPWENTRGRDQYFDAGGNGVCMRILPHVLNAHGSDTREIANRIILNGLCTHGHPRALVGALLHGMALWLSFRQEDMLEFGALIEAIFLEFPRWASLDEVPSKWKPSFSDSEFSHYRKIWEDTIGETMHLMKMARDSLRRGPLSVGPETLSQMGALNPKTNGSGTITAVASLFLASRYAASPLQGMVVAATATGADTDTLASMSGSILAAIHGYEWLGHFGSMVQDASYIRKIATKLVDKSEHSKEKRILAVRKKESTDFLNSLKTLERGSKLRLPDGRSGMVKNIEEMFSETARAELCKIELEDGQTIAIKRVVRGAKTTKNVRKPNDSNEAESILRVGIKLYVTDLAKAKDFYIHKLHFPIDKEYQTGFTMAGIISVHLADKGFQGRLPFRGDSLPQAIPCIRVANLSAIRERLSNNGIEILPANGSRSYKAIQIEDPFGNPLEIFEA
jgi:ADP-ribosylglycohydrolase